MPASLTLIHPPPYTAPPARALTRRLTLSRCMPQALAASETVKPEGMAPPLHGAALGLSECDPGHSCGGPARRRETTPDVAAGHHGRGKLSGSCRTLGCSKIYPMS